VVSATSKIIATSDTQTPAITINTFFISLIPVFTGLIIIYAANEQQ